MNNLGFKIDHSGHHFGDILGLSLAGPRKMNHFCTLGTTVHTLSHPAASGQPICTPGRPRRSIVATWALKTLPKWSLKRCQVDRCRPSQTCAGVSGLHVHPPWVASFSLPFRVRNSVSKNRLQKDNFTKHAPKWHTKCTTGTLQGDPKPSRIIKKSSLSHPGCLQVTFRLHGAPTPRIHRKL